MERAIDFYSASLPLVAGSVADSDLLRRQQQVNREAGTGAQLQAYVEYLAGPGGLRGTRDERTAALARALTKAAAPPAR